MTWKARPFIQLAAALALLFASTVTRAETIVFQSGFETEAEFAQFYITSHGQESTTRQELSAVAPYAGQKSHRAWITEANRESSFWVNRNHRAYPTIQFQKTEAGPILTPMCISLQVWADFALQARAGEDQWISLATFTDDDSDKWLRTVLVNVSQQGELHLQHVPRQGQQEHIFQSRTLKFPFREWVHVQIELDFSEEGFAKVWMNGALTSHARVEGMGSHLAQAHFGLYAAPSIDGGEIRNDALLMVRGRCSAP